MSEGLAQGSYVAASVNFEAATFWTQGTEPTTGPSRHRCLLIIEQSGGDFEPLIC